MTYLHCQIRILIPMQIRTANPNGYIVLCSTFHTAFSRIPITILTAIHRNAIGIRIRIGIRICECKWAMIRICLNAQPAIFFQIPSGIPPGVGGGGVGWKVTHNGQGLEVRVASRPVLGAAVSGGRWRITDRDWRWTWPQEEAAAGTGWSPAGQDQLQAQSRSDPRQSPAGLTREDGLSVSPALSSERCSEHLPLCGHYTSARYSQTHRGYAGFYWLVARWSYLSSCFWLFRPNDGFARKWMQLEWWEQSQVVGTANPYLLFWKKFKLFALSRSGDASPCVSSYAHTNEPPGETFTT